eukprot:5276957-Prymnesium_polylepis.1
MRFPRMHPVPAQAVSADTWTRTGTVWSEDCQIRSSVVSMESTCWASRASCRSRRLLRRSEPVARVRVTPIAQHAARDLGARLSLLFHARVLGRWPSRVECAVVTSRPPPAPRMWHGC